MEHRVTVLETTVSHFGDTLIEIKDDIRGLRGQIGSLQGSLAADYKHLLWGGIAACVTLFGAFTGGYVLLANRSEGISDKVSDVRIAIEHLSAAHNATGSTSALQSAPASNSSESARPH